MMAANSTTPTLRASSALSNPIPPGPSDPSSMPRPRNATSAGTPIRAAPNATTMAPASTAPMTRRSSPSFMPPPLPPPSPARPPAWLPA